MVVKCYDINLKEKNNIAMNVLINKKIRDKLEIISKNTNRSMSEVVRKLLEKALGGK